MAHSHLLLVPAKLTPPQPLGSWVRRERLLALLGPAPQAPLTLLVAPAGYGKSTLAAQWLLQAPGPRSSPLAWLTLDEHDQDPARFLAYVAGAIERAARGTLVASRGLLAAPTPPPLQVLLQALLVDLSAIVGGLTLVLDDYHAVAAAPIHQACAYLLRNLPPACRLVIISRVDPPLALARLRAERQVAELRAAELRFTDAETLAMLTALGVPGVDAALLASIQRQTEGWAVALQLAALAKLDAPAGELGAHQAARQITEYLADEVFARQPPAMQTALLLLALPDRFCAGLCAALFGTPADTLRAEEQLEQLLRANLLLAPIDDERQWFRFHHLFRDLLLHRLRISLSAEAIGELHLVAARWLADNGQLEEAVRHFLAASAEDAAADLVERLLIPETGRQVSGAPPHYWLQLLPAELVARRPGLALIAARLAVFRMDMAETTARLAHVDALLARPEAARDIPLWPTFMADVTALQGVLCYWQGRPAETIRHIRSALAQGPTAALAAQAMMQLGLAYVASGDYAQAVRLLEEGLPEVTERLDSYHTLCRPACLTIVHQMAGHLDAQQRAAQELYDAARACAADDIWQGYAAVSLGTVAYERDDLDAAARHFDALVSRKYKASYPGYMSGLNALALIAGARGDHATAAAYAREALAFADEVGGGFLQNQALGCAVQAALAGGDVAAALQAAARIRPDLHLGLSVVFEQPRLSQARALIAAGDTTSLALAEMILADCLAEIEPLRNTRPLIRALAMRALLAQARRRSSEARADLRRAVDLAEPQGFLRTLLDLGPALHLPLADLAEERPASAFLLRLLAAARLPAPHRQAPAVAILEPLTPREHEILALLARRWSDREIADHLMIAPNTVRKHTSTIYQKLGVGDRREAVAVAASLGLLPAEASSTAVGALP